MLDLNDLSNSPIEPFPYDFEIDINILVTANHQITLEGITREEEKAINNYQADDEDDAHSHKRAQENISEDLRRAANHLALVGLVTRFQYWINRFVAEYLKATNSKPFSVKKGMEKLETLNAKSFPKQDFLDLVDVRDSIIHQNATTKEWIYQGTPRRVAAQFIGEQQRTSDIEDKYLEVSEQQLRDATDKVIQQLKWYQEKLHPPKP